MYDGKNVGVTSTLCYGVQWDAMLDFIKDNSHNVTNSVNWGNYKDSLCLIDNKTVKYSEDYGQTWNDISELETQEKTSGKSILLTTGASDNFSAKNIYDIAGNVREMTMETDLTRNCRVPRGRG